MTALEIPNTGRDPTTVLTQATKCSLHPFVVYFVEEEYLVTALVPSETACLASSPGKMSRTEVWISRDEMVDFLLYAASLEASVATRSKMSIWRQLTNHGNLTRKTYR